MDLQWGLLTNASANFGNALAGAAGQIRQRRDQSRDRTAISNYLANPTDPAAFQGAAERNPEMAFRVRDRQEERQRQLTARQREELGLAARLVGRDPRDPAYVRDEATWQTARQLAQRAGLDLTGIPETYDERFVAGLRDYDSRVNRVAPVSVAEGARLIDPETGAVVGQGNPPRPRYYSVPPGGRLELDPSYQGPTTEEPPPVSSPAPAAASPPRAPAGTVETYQGRRYRLNEAGQWEDIGPEGGQSRQDSGYFPGRAMNRENPAAVPANWTSGRRTPEGNRAVGGVPNSAHLTGDAADFTPRAGQSMSQLAAELRRRFPGARVINEGDHVHVQQSGWGVPYHGRRGSQGAR
jgi:hypothetical protein